jgi:hypothetical protein
MKQFVISMLALTALAGCTTTKIVEVEKPVPIYLTIHPEKPTLELKELQWLYLPEQELLALDTENFDTYNNNNAAIEAYILKLQEAVKYYEQATTVGP